MPYEEYKGNKGRIKLSVVEVERSNTCFLPCVAESALIY